MNGFVVIIALAASTYSAEQGPAYWISSYSNALDDARATRRPLLVVFQEPGQSVHKLESPQDSEDTNTALTVNNVQSSNNGLLSKYTLCRVDVSTAYGRRVAGAFQVKKFPYTAITDRRARRIVYRREGGFTQEAWVNTLVAYQAGEQITPRGVPNHAAARKSYFPISPPTFSPPATSSTDLSTMMCPT